MPEEAPSARPDRAQVIVRVAVPIGLRSSQEVMGFLSSEWRSAPPIELDSDYGAVEVQARRARRDTLRARGQHLVIVRGWIDPAHIPALKEQPFVDHVERDAPLEPFAGLTGSVHQPVAREAAPASVDCGRAAGTAADVARVLAVDRIWAAGYRGRDIVVAVVDGGITAHGRPMQGDAWPAIPQAPATGEVVSGWPLADWGTNAEGWGQHGNMIAFDVQAMAPEAQLWDIRIGRPGLAFTAVASNAVLGYRRAIDHYRQHRAPHILVNSWGLYDSVNGPDYAFNPDSAIALYVEEAIEEGILVLFAAGNCGDGCPFAEGTPCGPGDRGPGASILGPNGHPDVMTVGAATLHGVWCGYTSQGPAVLPPNDPDKPDFCAVSQFEGFFPNESGLRPWDGGTSAANAIAAGVVALLKEARPDLGQEECKQLLKSTARPILAPVAHGGAGAGLIDAFRAFRAL
jgi:subtilisin family serine protease